MDVFDIYEKKKIGKPIKENYYKNRLDLEAWH